MDHLFKSKAIFGLEMNGLKGTWPLYLLDTDYFYSHY